MNHSRRTLCPRQRSFFTFITTLSRVLHDLCSWLGILLYFFMLWLYSESCWVASNQNFILFSFVYLDRFNLIFILLNLVGRTYVPAMKIQILPRQHILLAVVPSISPKSVIATCGEERDKKSQSLSPQITPSYN